MLFSLLLLAFGETSGKIPEPGETSGKIPEPGKTIFISRDGEVKTHPVSQAVATVAFKDFIQSTGWSMLKVKTNGSYPDREQAWSAGLGEGYITAHRILQHWNNTMSGYCATPSKYCDKLFHYIEQNFKWMNMMIDRYRDVSSYWHQVDLIQVQLEGLHSGFDLVYPKVLSLHDFQLMNMMGDLMDLENALGGDEVLRSKADTNSKFTGNISRETEHMLENVLGSGHCSAFIKWTGDDLLASHVTWSSYQTMIRIVKDYQFGFKSGGYRKEVMPGSRQVFTGYPGFIFSGDDYTIIGSGLLSQETTLGNLNDALWVNVGPMESVPEYMRSILANRLATDGKTWCSTFEQYNSGTYNNQWMIVDYNLFEPNNGYLKPGTLYVLEQLPGTIEFQDKTSVLSGDRYWPSYNTPYYPSIFNLSGSQDLVDRFGPFFAYETNPRGEIFRRENGSVTDMESLYKLMRYNDYKNDPFARCEGCSPPYSAINAIASRSDLNPSNGTYPLPLFGSMLSGAIDYKATNFSLMKRLGMRMAAGPTWEQQPPFRWSSSRWKNVSHVGIEDLQQFGEITIIAGETKKY